MNLIKGWELSDGKWTVAAVDSAEATGSYTITKMGGGDAHEGVPRFKLVRAGPIEDHPAHA